MKPTLQILGSSSKISEAYYLKNKKKFMFDKYSSSNIKDKNISDFFFQNKKNTTILMFSYIRKNPSLNIPLLNKIIKHCKKNGCKLIYISSINACNPMKSKYSFIKKECEKIVTKNNFYYIRLGIVITKKPFGPYKSLLKLRNLNLNLCFQKNLVIFLSKIDSFTKIDLTQLNKNETIIDEEHNLNKYIRNKKAKLNINVQLLVSLITFLNKYLKLPNFLDRILTLCAFNK
jgi:hypothetical protein